jgi:hypothetical protein
MSRRPLAIVLLVLAASLAYVATDGPHSLTGQFNNVLAGRFSERSTWMFAGAIVAAMLGLYLLLVGRRRRWDA